ncbi:DUF1656 domain-containing protein [Ectopseudomonas mendocina]|uniref:DUF1656 domain-containing protein n=1 Tax=Ectopseudomonas mendocina TaxID=300 RepID=A0ABZ2RHV6_ECTME
MPIDFEIGGLYLPPLAQAILLALPIFFVLDWLVRKTGLMKFVWHEALFEGALYTCVCAGVILWMGNV